MLQRALCRRTLVKIRGLTDVANESNPGDPLDMVEDENQARVILGSCNPQTTVRRLLAGLTVSDHLPQPKRDELLLGLQKLLYTLFDEYKVPGRERPRSQDLPKIASLKVR